MPYVNNAGLGVFNQYGARSTGNSVGTDHSQNSVHELNLEITGTSLADSQFIPPYVVPKGVRFTRATLVVDQAFTLTGTTPTVQFGGAAPQTNGITLSAANLGSVQSIDVSASLAGTWATASAAGTTASETCKLQLGGTTPAVTAGVGKATLALIYIYKHRELGSVN